MSRKIGSVEARSAIPSLYVDAAKQHEINVYESDGGVELVAFPVALTADAAILLAALLVRAACDHARRTGGLEVPSVVVPGVRIEVLT